MGHLGQETQKVAQCQSLARPRLSPDGQVARVIAPKDAGEVAAELLDFRITHVCVEYLLQYRQLLRTDQLLVVEESPILDDRVVGHVLNLAEHLAPHCHCVHWKNTSNWVQWKHMYINLSPARESSLPVEHESGHRQVRCHVGIIQTAPNQSSPSDL